MVHKPHAATKTSVPTFFGCRWHEARPSFNRRGFSSNVSRQRAQRLVHLRELPDILEDVLHSSTSAYFCCLCHFCQIPLHSQRGFSDRPRPVLPNVFASRENFSVLEVAGRVLSVAVAYHVKTWFCT